MKELLENRYMRKTGLFFGSFNPVHIGHMAIANYMVEFTDLEQVWFIVSPQNPLKEKSSLLPARQRYELVRLAIGDFPKFKVSDIEFSLPVPSYTIDTLIRLREKCPDRNFVLIMGADNLLHLHKWKNYKILIQDYGIYVYPRPGISPDTAYPQNILLTEAPLIEISSFFIRKALNDGKDIRYFLNDAVYKYITEMHFYEK